MSTIDETTPTAPSPQKAVRADPLFDTAPRRKGRLLPIVAELAMEGYSGYAIAQRLALPKRTINHWLEELRKEWAAQASQIAAESLGVGLARLDTIYREAMQAWRDSTTGRSASRPR